MNKRDRLTKKLREALDEDKTLQGDLGIQEVEEILLFLMNESAPEDSVVDQTADKDAHRQDETENVDPSLGKMNESNVDEGNVDEPQFDMGPLPPPPPLPGEPKKKDKK